ncbi:type II toxin-antitoxin system VapC family toxin [Thermococcus sp. ES12]|uniref:type II toxin-antitoxin system VapC family toxin n=1 Tax=Thermococcus sp. ES12 TaxID=1638246 RepID=UPI0014302DC0|nr:type II toxin-antitoxin system VapC family toxin [Thermococcus sp. ES12]NJE77191.1 PIN domain-containing protein [Thermococcus sp. ES12]
MRVFFDSNVFLKFLGGDENAKLLLQLALRGDVEGVISPIVLSEVTYGYLRLTTGLSPYNLKKKLLKVEVDLLPVGDLLSEFTLLNPEYSVGDLLDVIYRYRLLPNDASIALTCKIEGIEKIATFDSDFERVDFVEIMRP